MTVTVCPATGNVPVRSAPALLATEKVTEPFPVPLVAEVSAMKSELLVAVQLQVMPPPTVTVDVPPDMATERLAGDTEKLHEILNVSTGENAVVSVPLVARARQ